MSEGRILRINDPDTSALRLDLSDEDAIDHSDDLSPGDLRFEKVKISQPPHHGDLIVSRRLANGAVTGTLIITPQVTYQAVQDLYELLVIEMRRSTNELEFRPKGASASFFFDLYEVEEIPTLFPGRGQLPDRFRRDASSGLGYWALIPISWERHPIARGAGEII